jgi:hypothetical protein
MPRRLPAFRLLIAIACSGLLPMAPAFAQSTAASQASAISIEPSEASAAVVVEALPAGSELVVTALRPVGDLVELSVETAGHVSITGLRVSAEVARRAGLVVGCTLAVTVVSAGWLVSEAGETIAFLPDQLARSLTHHREL